MAREDLKRLVSLLLSPVYPLYCPVCKQEWENGEGYICPDCWESLPRSKRYDHFGLGGESTPIASLFRYDEILRDLVLRMKFFGRTDIAVRFGQIAGEQIKTNAADRFTAVVPVPLHPVRLRERGYNQVGIIAEQVAGLLNVPCRTDLVVRSRHTSPQSALSDGERIKNVLNAFIPGNRGDELPPSPVLLIDDVMHTGSTLRECATAVRSCGIAEVVAIAVVH